MKLLALGLLMLAVPACDRPAQPEVGARTAGALELTGPVVDRADLLTPQQEERIALKAMALEKDVGPQYVVVTVKSLDGRPVEKYSLDLARQWGLGDKDRDDGLMLLVAPREKGLRIEVGTGLEQRISNQYAAKILNERALPHFREGRFSKGIEAVSDALIARLRSTASQIERKDKAI